MKRGKYILAGLSITLPSWFALNVAMYFTGGFASQAYVAIFPILLVGMLLFDKKLLNLLLIFTIINGLLVAILQTNNMLPASVINTVPLTTYIIIVLILFLSGVILDIYKSALILYSDEIRDLNLQTYTLNNKNRVLMKSDIEIKGKVHDFKNNLHAIQVNVEDLNYQIENEPTGSISKFNNYDKILDLIEDSNNIIKRLLDSNLNYRMTFQILYIPEIMKRIDEWLNYQVPSNIHHSTKSTTNCIIELDLDKFDDVCINIIGNAIDAISDDGRIEIFQRCETISEAFKTKSNQILQPGRYEIFTFRDNGRGIPASNQDKIFFANFTTKSNGSGFGLLHTKSIIKQHKGYIDFHSEENEFTEFLIYIPHINQEENAS